MCANNVIYVWCIIYCVYYFIGEILGISIVMSNRTVFLRYSTKYAHSLVMLYIYIWYVYTMVGLNCHIMGGVSYSWGSACCPSVSSVCVHVTGTCKHLLLFNGCNWLDSRTQLWITAVVLDGQWKQHGLAEVEQSPSQ